MRKILYAALAATLPALVAHAQPAELDSELAAVQADWATANYATPSASARIDAFEALSKGDWRTFGAEMDAMQKALQGAPAKAP